MFWYCEIVQEFWERVELHIAEKSNKTINIHKYSAVFGTNVNNIINKPENYILMLTRFYILYKSRINNKKMYLNLWKSEIKTFLATEKMIAIKNRTYDSMIFTY